MNDMTPAIAEISAELAEELRTEPIDPLDVLGCPPFLELPNGIHMGVPEAVYHQRILGVASKGAIDKMIEAPAVYRAWISGYGDDTESKSLAFGKVAHCFALEPSTFARTYVVEPEFGACRKHDESGTTTEQAKENKKRRDEWRSRHVGATLVSARDLALVTGMRDALSRDPDVGPHFRALWNGAEGYMAEATIRWECKSTGLICRARPDLFVLGGQTIMIDVKSTADCRLDPFNRSRKEYGYHRQEYHYRTGASAIGYPVDRFLFAAVEKTPPFLMQVYDLNPELASIGESEVETAKSALIRCLVFDEWPGLEPGVKTLPPLPWEKRT